MEHITSVAFVTSIISSMVASGPDYYVVSMSGFGAYGGRGPREPSYFIQNDSGPDSIDLVGTGDLGACSQYGSYDFLETLSIYPSHAFRRALAAAPQWME